MSADERIVLASASPRRQRLLREAGLSFEVVPADLDERRLPGETPADFARRAAGDKGLTVATRLARRSRRPWIVAADTVVALGDELLTKPRDREHAAEMLSLLAGRAHTVVTGWTVGRHEASWTAGQELTEVVFHPLEENEIEFYAATGEGDDKAGAYAIQGIGAFLVERIQGDYFNVVGLPISRVLRALVAAGALQRYPLP